MSLTRIICTGCDRPLVYCTCRTLVIGAEQPAPVKLNPGTIDFSYPPVTAVTNCNNYTSPPPKKKGRSKFF
jgi:hypothetical protein